MNFCSPLRGVLACGLLALIFGIASCGYEAPKFAPGSITVTADTVSAQGDTLEVNVPITIDGTATGEETPHTFADLESGQDYVVRAGQDGFVSTPDSHTVFLTPLENAVASFVLSATALTVTSNPEGARIYLGGVDSGQVTPATIGGINAGPLAVALELDGYYIAPASYTVDIVGGEINVLPPDTFAMRSKKTVMMEGFSNVDCGGCPEMGHNVNDFMEHGDYGTDRALYMKFSMQWPAVGDPHYQHNTPENDERMFYYQSIVFAGIPAITLDGAEINGSGPNGTPTDDEINVLVGAAVDAEPGFLIDVTADFSVSPATATVTLTPVVDIDLTGLTLYVAAVQSFIEYEEAPGSEGETEFHWLFLDKATTTPTLGALTAGTPQSFNLSLPNSDGHISPDEVIAFVQDDADKRILQAGSSIVPVTAAVLLGSESEETQSSVSGGSSQ